MLVKRDIEQLKKKGITGQSVKQQIKRFHSGFSYADIAAPAMCGAGILVLTPGQVEHYVKRYDQEAEKLSVMKFVPASGAATRMFKSVYDWREKLRGNVSADVLMKEDEAAKMFFENIRDFAFWDELSEIMKKNGFDAEAGLKNGDYLSVLDFLLDNKGLNYGSLPKGLMKFHKYNDYSRTAFEEHLVESTLYGKNGDGKVNIHFTVSPEHIELFYNLFAGVVGFYEDLSGVRHNITFSIQDPSTDTLAVDMENNPFREAGGELLFRPGGHGALINNLNTLDDDLIFIKNIDNVVPDRLKEPTVLYKKATGGLLLELQQEVYRFQKLSKTGEFSDNVYEEAMRFACGRLNFDPALFSGELKKQKELLSKMFYAPIRVCGMVKNEGEPGGGPFWVYDKNKIKSLQIVESSQVNLDDSKQAAIFNSSTHFNPVDIVCSVKDYQGNKYVLKKYIDPDTGFISHKSKDGRPLKALELPGLWNGAMAKWITIFTEVPAITFNPVKSINDLLREEHQ